MSRSLTSVAQFEKEQLPARLAAWEKKRDVKAKAPEAVGAILKTPAAERKAEQQAELLKWYRTIDPERKKLDQQVQEHAKKAPAVPKMLVATEGLRAGPAAHAGRGLLPGDVLPAPRRPRQQGRRGDAELPAGADAGGRGREALADAAAGRLRAPRIAAARLAEWLTDVEHGAGHLLARVIVNRLWQHHLGRGIVATPSDFGVRGETPTHPELLDWLAAELIKNGWRLKPIHKLIMTSAVYQQSCRRRRGQGARSTATTAVLAASRRAGWRPRSSATPCSPSAASSTATHVRPRHARRSQQAPQHLLHRQAQQARCR